MINNYIHITIYHCRRCGVVHAVRGGLVLGRHRIRASNQAENCFHMCDCVHCMQLVRER